MITVVYACFGCAGEEEPHFTHTTRYRGKDGRYHVHWLCRDCVKRFSAEGKLRDLTHEDMHPDAQTDYDGSSPCREVEEITQGKA